MGIDLNIENAVLSAFMLESHTCADAIVNVRPVWFSITDNRLICEAIKTLHHNNEIIDLISVANVLDGSVKPYDIAKVAHSVVSTANVNYHIRLLQQLWVKRELGNIGEWLKKEVEDPFKTITDIKERLASLELTQDFKVKNLSEIVQQQADSLDLRRKSEVKIVGKRSGSPQLDRLTGGLVAGELIICAGRPGMGKTAFAVSLGIEHCRQGGAALMFSIEMPENQIADRAISGETDIDNMKIRTANLDDYEMSRIREMDLPQTFYINDNARLNIDSIGAVVKSMKAKYNLTFVIIDYMQLIRSESKGKNREQEVAYISNTCKRIAKESEVCVMALAQLSRDVEKRGGAKIPQLADLRESGSIEQDADIVLFPFRPDYYLLSDENHEPRHIEDAKLIIAKCRNGVTGNIDLQFKPSSTKYIF